MNIGTALEITANAIQQVMSLVFLYLFFDKPSGRAKRLLPFVSAALLLLAVTVYGTVSGSAAHDWYYLATAVITILYTAVFLRGKHYLRIIIPLAVSNISVAYLTVSAISAFGTVPFAQAVTLPASFRYSVLFAADILYAAFLFVIYRFGKGKINMRSQSDILAFIVIPLITCTVGVTALLLLNAVDFDGIVQIYVTVITLCTAVMVVLFWYLMIKSGKESQIKSDLMLSKQREELYKSSVLRTHEQIEKISVIRHDMKSHLLSVSSLIAQGEYDKAKAVCDSVGKTLSATYTPVHTDNPTLNAIMNVELEKAQSHEIDCTYEIIDTLSFMSDTDTISLIANLCDNAIEYLARLPQEQRQMSLRISSYKSYCKVVCRNALAASVLAENPDLHTTKGDPALHGKGMTILSALAKKYSGELLIHENNKQLIISIMITESNEG